MNYDVATEESDDRLSFGNQLPRIRLIAKSSPRDIQSTIYYRSETGEIYQNRWSISVGDTWRFAPGKGDFGHLLPTELNSFWYFDKAQYGFTKLGNSWTEAVNALIKMRLAALAGDVKVIADTAPKSKVKPKRNGHNQLLGADASYLQKIKDEARF